MGHRYVYSTFITHKTQRRIHQNNQSQKHKRFTNPIFIPCRRAGIAPEKLKGEIYIPFQTFGF